MIIYYQGFKVEVIGQGAWMPAGLNELIMLNR